MLERDPVDFRLVQRPVMLPGPGGRAQGLQRQPRVDLHRPVAAFGRDQHRGAGQLRQDVDAVSLAAVFAPARHGRDQAHPDAVEDLVKRPDRLLPVQVAGNQQGLGPVDRRPGRRVTVDRHGRSGVEHPGTVP